jgi:HAD superfamily hydrolase (TIGR01549 family)
MNAKALERASVVLFDFGGTLDSDGIPWKARFFRIWQDEVGEIAPAVFDRAFYDADDAVVGHVAAQTPLAETVGRVARGLVQGLRRAADEELAERIAARFLADARERLSSSAVLLKRLSRKYRLGIVSNFYGNLEAVCRESGIAPHLSVAIDSAAVGFRKPDARIFQAALAPLDTAPSDAIFVGDSLPRDMAGARAIGMPHVWLSTEESPCCCPEDPVIRSLADLEEILA